jgi:hypothetical protein
MDEARFDQLLVRVETLEKDRQRWKAIAITALVALGLLVLPVAIGFCWLVFVAPDRHLEALHAEQEAEMQQLRLEQQLEREAERNRVEVERGELHMQRILLERDQKVLQLERERLIQELEKEKARHKAAP